MSSNPRIDGYLSRLLADAHSWGVVWCYHHGGPDEKWELHRGLDCIDLGPSFQAARSAIEALIHSEDIARQCETDS
jgi:hypothetical protein